MAAPQALRIVASRPDPAIVTLPWYLPLEEWTEHVVPLPRGLSRHIVRIVRLGDRTYAVKETEEASRSGSTACSATSSASRSRRSSRRESSPAASTPTASRCPPP